MSAGYNNDSQDYGIIIRTADNGTTWDTVFTTLSDTRFCDIVYTDTCTIIAVGHKNNFAEGIIARSGDNGNTWDTTVFANGLLSVSFPSENIGYASGGNGTIYKTIDEGNNWTPLSTGLSSTIGSVFFINDTVGFALTQGFILKTLNGGSSWISQNIPINNYFFGTLSFPSDSVGYFYTHNGGDSMRIYKTIDCGNSWSLASTSYSDQFLCNIHFVNNSTGYVCGYFQIQKTTNGGITWTQQSTVGGFPNFMDWVSELCFLSIDTGFAAGHQVFYRLPSGNLINADNYAYNKDINNIYPNPFTNNINIEFLASSQNNEKILSLYSIQGKLILRQKAEKNLNINLSFLDKGVYVLNILSSDINETRKIIKE